MSTRTLIRSFDLHCESLSNRDYHARPELGSSTLKTLDRDGAEMASLKQAGGSQDDAGDSRALIVGSAVHAFVEGNLGQYVEAPDAHGYKTTTSEKFQAMAGELAEAGQTLLSRAEFATVKQCTEALERKFGGYLFGRQKWIEPSLFWNQPVESRPGEIVSCKCRPDVLVDHGDKSAYYLEIKTAADNGEKAWRSACWRYGYWIQQAHYEAGIKATSNCEQVRTLFVVVRSKPPHIVRLYEFDELTRASAHRKWLDLIAEYSRRLNECDWQDEIGLNPTMVDLGLSVADDLEGDD
jgi:hypothetical protein